MAKKVKGAKAAKDALPRLKTSLYTSLSVTLHFGPTHQIYYLPEVLLQRLENIPSRDPWTHEIHLVDVDASIGHVLIHFLHTGVYQTLNDEYVEDAENTHKTFVRNEFQTAVLALEAAKKYRVPGLQELAQIELERRGKEMCLCDAVRAIREEFIAGPPDEHAWLRDFVSKKVRWTFEQDPPMLSAPDFFENIESPTLVRLLAQVIVGLYSEEVDKLRKGKTATDKMSTPEHSEPPGSYSPDLGQDPGNRPEAIAPAASSSCNKEETIELEKRMKEDAVAKERENAEARVREKALAEIQQLGAERGTIVQLQEQDVAVASLVAPVISGKKKKGKKGHTAGSPPPPPSPPPPRMSPPPPSSPPNIQLEVEREEEEHLQREEEERLEQERLEREEQERIAAEEAERAAEEERARIEAEEVKAARIAAEEEEACYIAKEEAKASSKWGVFGLGKKKESTKLRREREAKEKKEREEQERLERTTVIADVAAVAAIVPDAQEDLKVEVYPYAGLSESLAKKLKARLDEKARLKEEEEAAEVRLREEEEEAERRRLEEEAAAAAAEAETSRKKEDDIWGEWSALSAGKMKKKGKKGERLRLEEEERLVKEVEEEAERRKKEEEEAAAAAKPMVVSATSGLSWEEKLALNTDDWAAFGAGAPGKKKGKKGKTAEPVPPPPLDPPAEPPTTFDDINLDEASAPKIDMNFGDTSANKSGFELPGHGNWTSGWGSSNKGTNADGDNPWGSSDKKKKNDGFDFDFDAFKNPPAKEKLAKNDGWCGLGATTKTKKKSKKGVLIDDSALEVPPPPPEPEKKEEDDSWGAFGFGSTAKYKKKKKKGVLEEEPPPPKPEPEPVVDEPSPAKEEDPWGGGWGAAAAGTKKKKGKKGELEPEPEPVPELEPEPEPRKVEVDPYTGLSKSQGKKLKAKLDKEAKLKEEEDAKRQKEEEEADEIRRQEEEEAERIRLEEEETELKKMEEEEATAAAAEAGVNSFDSAIETGATSKDGGCELRSEHLSRDDGWQNCKPCELYMRKIALKLYSVGLPNVNGFSTTNGWG
ncbi:hypothetical protein BDW02DRAFT_652053 [Decorospora gaudefroyi]|uniref:BTB domain-containing protein n=1 Tax=Decorospora gaudefroyi TaxID=184978 RepID=A0A6A5JXW9_9PLEO|nr:hypothetical protein BDW02DRAFT_652053 [Decorospora gaudefroyi]